MKASLLLSMFLAASSLCAQNSSQIYVDLASRGHDVQKSMYGIFFEEINHAGDGGLYAEMVQNRGFEEQVLPGGMTLKENGRAYAPHSLNYYGLDYVDSWVSWDVETLKWKGWAVTSSGCSLTKDVVTPDNPLHENTPNALQLVIKNTNATAKVNVDNSGYWGMAYKAGETYKLRFYLSSNDYNGSVKAILTNASGTSLGEADFEVISDGQWHEYTATLSAKSTITNGKLRLQFSAAGTVNVDYVSLFPTDTYKGRENGLRRDIAETLEAMHPAFMRWPGGCIVEGITLENRVKWKETIGDPMTRRGEFSLWGYRSTYGLGMYEFLQLCEDMNMDGMFVANVGMSCSIRNGDFIDPSDEAGLLPFRQDIEDAIEYALGDPATNEWAAKRAAAGHPDPFPLKYVELGNENGTARYSKRYAFFYNYLKAKYPQITFINTLAWWDNGLFSDYDKTDMLDVHWYVAPDEFYNDATLFENAYRGKNGNQDFTIYAGEYAANNEVGQGNMDAALSEAAFIGAMERNSDYVTMASYAPLLTNVNQPNWACNLIWYDNHQVMGRASYYVQTMYADNRPDYNVKTRIYSDAQTLISEGKIGLGTWATTAKFRNLKVTSLDGTETFYTSDFENQLNDWTEFSGTWSVNGEGDYIQTSTGTPCLSFVNTAAFRNCAFEVEAMKTAGAEGFLIAFGADTTNVNTHYRINMGGWGNTKTAIEKVVNGGSSIASESVAQTITTNKWYKIRVETREGDGIYCYVDGKLLLSYKTGDILNGRLQAFGGYDEENGEIVVKVVNAKSEKLTSTIHLNADNIAASGKVITLKADKLTDENSLDNPKRIAPAESSFTGFAKEFEYTFEPNSFTIFRIKTDKSASESIDFPVYEYDDTPIPLAEAAMKRSNAISCLEQLIKLAEENMIEDYSPVANLKENVENAKTLLNNTAALTKELEEGCETMQDAISSYFKSMMMTSNEFTSKIQNANFSTMSNSGWQGSAPALEHNVGEFFNTTFNSYQNLSGLENGCYLVYVQAFYRNGTQAAAYPTYIDRTEQLNAQLYAGTKSVNIRSLYGYSFSFGSWNNFCDNREQAEKAFNQGGDTYANYLIVEVTNGTLRLGVRKTKSVNADWTCFNNFRLFKIQTNEEEPEPQQATVWGGNPVITTHYSADPAPMVFGDTFYIYYDHDLGVTPAGDTYYWMEEWRVASSDDMVNWTDHGSSLPLSQFKWAGDGSAWASQCVERDGKFYWYTCAEYPGKWHGIGVAVCDSPTGLFRDALGKPLISTGILGDIDPTVFIDDDGQAYLYWGNNKLCYAKLNKNMTSIDKTIGNNGVVEIKLTTEGFGGLKVDGKVEGENCFEEGPWLMKRNGIYYLIYAAGGVPENIAYSTSDSPTGPWTYRGKIMPVSDTASFTNHCGAVEYNGKWYFFYHTGWLNEGKGGGGFNRSVAIEEMSFNADGTIKQIEPTRKGVKAIKTLDPFEWHYAATMNNSAGVTVEGNDIDGLYVTDISTLDSIAVANVAFGEEGAKSVTLRYATTTSGCKVYVMLDKARGGTRVATIDLPVTDSLDDIQEYTFDFLNNRTVTDTHRLIFYFYKNQDTRFYNWRFNKDDAETVAIDNLTTEPSQSRPTAIYDLSGRRLIAPAKGINIFRYSDGTTRKILIK